jgi:HAD superfamily hydrolase (TIGR01549 family)
MNVIFDMDGTLLRLDVDIEEVRLKLAALFAPHGVTRPFRPVLARIKAAAIEAGDPSLEAAGLAILSGFEVDAASSARAREGAAKVIATLKDRGAKLAIVTDNGRACVAPALAAAGIPAEAFDAIVTRDDVPAPKPDPAGVRAAAAALGGDPLWYVGDHTKDVEAGRAAGVRVAAIRGTPGLGRGGLVPDEQLRADRLIDELAGVLLLD